MRMRSRLLRTSAAAVLGSMLVLQPGVGVSAEGGGGTSKMPPPLRARVSGLLDLALNSDDAGVGTSNTRVSNFFAGRDECNVRRGTNLKVNQNCLNVSDADLQGRGQAQNETAVAVDPNDSRRIVTGYNDYRRGDGTCGTSYSQDGGRTWNDSTAPNGFTRGFGGFAREYWQGGGDTSVAWDSRGNAYLSCQLFNRGQPTSPNPDQSSTFVVFRSTQNGGASWDFPGRYVTLNQDTDGSGVILEDKQYLTVDNSVSSPFRDRLYVTWTEFTASTAYIYAAFSAD
ncbi:MAG TPA: exo-alpha-sialidase, partial [Chloroflexota bacterium]